MPDSSLQRKCCQVCPMSNFLKTQFLAHPIRFPVTNGAAGLAVRTGSTHIVNNADDCQKLNKNLDDIIGCSIQNILSVPLTACGK